MQKKNNEKIIHGMNLLRLQPKKEIVVPQYITYLFSGNKFKNNIKRITKKSVNQASFTVESLKQIVIQVPAISQQELIAKKMDIIKQIVKVKQKEIYDLDYLVKARFVEMFGSYPINQKGWDIVRIRDVVKEVKYGTSRPATQAGKYPYLRMNNITYNGELELSDIKYIDVPKTELSNCTVQYGDVLFNRTNSKELVGKTCVYNQNNMMVLAGFIIRIRVNERVLPQFLSTYLNTDFSKKMLAAMCKTAIGQANINAQELQNICIYVPPIKLQEEFVKFKKQTDKSKDAIQKSLDETQLLFDSLMQKYFG